jgi:hypothetical protein
MTKPKIADAAVGVSPPPAPLVPAESMPHTPSAGAQDPLLAMIADAARDPAVDLAKLQGLMALKKEVEADRARRAFFAALALAKGEFGPIIKTRVVDYPHKDERGRTSYKHEDFFDVAIVVDPVLSKHGLSYRPKSTQEGGRIKVTCILSHADGHSEENSLESIEDKTGQKNAAQAIASTVTYLQRYTLKEALGIAAGRDDDGGDPDPDQGLIDGDQLIQIQELLKETQSNLEIFFDTVGCGGFTDMTIAQWKRGVALLNEKKRRMAGKAS